MFALTGPEMEKPPPAARELWQGALARPFRAPELKVVVFRKSATDLTRRFGCRREEVDRITSFTKPSLFRDLEGYEIPAASGRANQNRHHAALPARSTIRSSNWEPRRIFTAAVQVDLGHLQLAWPVRKGEAVPVLSPTCGYAFAVSNSLGKKSWHGREEIPAGSGVRNSLLNLFFATPRPQLLKKSCVLSPKIEC